MKKKFFKQLSNVQNLSNNFVYHQVYKSLQSNYMLLYKIRLMLEFFKTPNFYGSILILNKLHLICFSSYRLKSVFKFINLSRLELNVNLFKNFLYGYIKY